MAAARDLPRLWFLLPFVAVPLPPWVVGVAVAAGVVVAYVGMELVFGALGRVPEGEPGFWERGDLRQLVPGALLLGYVPAALCYGVGAIERAWAELRPLVRNPDEDLEALAREQPTLGLRGFRLAGLAGGLVWIAILPLLSPVSFVDTFRVQYWARHDWFGIALNLVLFVMFAQVLYALVRASTNERLVQRLFWDLDLLDLRPLRPLVRQGLTHALLCVVGISILSLAFLENPPERGQQIVFQLSVVAVTFAAAVTALVLPLRNAHRLIAWKKGRELDALRAAIRGDRHALAGTAIESQARELSVADMIAYRELIARVPEWPIERGAILRIVLYLAIPIGSWVGGALVERVVEAILG